jgi:hypothetical protein
MKTILITHRMMRLQWGIGVLLIAALGAPAAKADLYQINFTGDPPSLLPTAGSFTYDPTAHTFAAFLVTWDSLVFDMTNFANAPTSENVGFPGCIGSNTGGAATFALLSGACNSPQPGETTFWEGASFLPSDLGFTEFVFLSGTNGHSCIPGFPPCDGIVLSDLFSTPSSFTTEPGGSGSWTITKEAGLTPTPEPSPLGTTALGLLSLAAGVTQRSHRRRT